MKASNYVLVGAWVLLSGFIAAPASAQPSGATSAPTTPDPAAGQKKVPGPVERARAKALVEKGNELYDNGAYADALRYYVAATRLNELPLYIFSAAKTYTKLNFFVEAKSNFTKVIEADGPGSTAIDVIRLKADAEVERTMLEPRIPKLHIIVTDAPAQNVVVTVDGVEVPHLDRPLQQNPGSHTITARVPGGETVATSVMLEEGGEVRKEISLARSPLNPRKSYMPAILSFAVGGLGLGGAIAAGVVASGAPERKGLWATMGIGVGVAGLGIGAGTSLLLVRSVGATGAPSSEIAVRATIGPGSISLTGTF